MFELAQLENGVVAAQIIMDMETQLAEHHWLKEDNRDGNKRYNKYTRSELDGLFSNMDMDAYLGITGANDIPDAVINQPSFFEGFNALLGRN